MATSGSFPPFRWPCQFVVNSVYAITSSQNIIPRPGGKKKPLSNAQTGHHILYPIGSMYGLFTYIYHKNKPNVDKYTIHGSYGYARCLQVKNDGDSSKNESRWFCIDMIPVLAPVIEVWTLEVFTQNADAYDILLLFWSNYSDLTRPHPKR